MNTDEELRERVEKWKTWYESVLQDATLYREALEATK